MFDVVNNQNLTRNHSLDFDFEKIHFLAINMGTWLVIN